MEPRSFDRGKPPLRIQTAAANRLQWSRDRLIAERKETDPRLPPSAVASMEPRSFDRGKPTFKAQSNLFWLASMEPRSFDRGKSKVPKVIAGRLLLQWSRDRLIAESKARQAADAGRGGFNGAAIV